MNLLGTSKVAKAQAHAFTAGYQRTALNLPLDDFNSTCITQGQFVTKVAARLQGPPPNAQLAPHFLVSIEGPTLEGRIVGFVDIQLQNGQMVRRHVNGSNCASVSDALAIVVALSLEAGNAENPQRIPLVLIRPPRVEAAPIWAVGGGVSAITTNVLSRRSPVLGLAGQVQVRFSTDLIDPMVSVGFYRFDNVLVRAPVKDLHLDLAFARLTVWPAAVPLTDSIEFRPGLFTELGQLSALESPGLDSWWAGGADLSLGWVARWVTFTGSVGAVLPLRTQTFSAKGTGQEIHSIKGLGIFAQLGAAVWIL